MAENFLSDDSPDEVFIVGGTPITVNLANSEGPVEVIPVSDRPQRFLPRYPGRAQRPKSRILLANPANSPVIINIGSPAAFKKERVNEQAAGEEAPQPRTAAPSSVSFARAVEDVERQLRNCCTGLLQGVDVPPNHVHRISYPAPEVAEYEDACKSRTKTAEGGSPGPREKELEIALSAKAEVLTEIAEAFSKSSQLIKNIVTGNYVDIPPVGSPSESAEPGVAQAGDQETSAADNNAAAEGALDEAPAVLSTAPSSSGVNPAAQGENEESPSSQDEGTKDEGQTRNNGLPVACDPNEESFEAEL